MRQANLLPCFLLAISLHALPTFWYLQKAPTKAIKMAGENGNHLNVALDNHAYQDLMAKQQASKSKQQLKKVSPAPKVSQPQKKPSQQKQAKQKNKTPKVSKPDVKPLAKTVKENIATSSVVHTKPVAQSKQPTQSQTAEVKLVKVVNTTTVETNTNTSNSTSTSTVSAEPYNPVNQGDQTAQASSNTKSIGSTAPLVMNDETKAYLRKLMQHLHRYKSYPNALKKAGVEGEPVVRFSINQHGDITALSIKKSSSNVALDHAALNVFKKADPLPAIPTALKRDALSMSLPINFNLTNE